MSGSIEVLISKDTKRFKEKAASINESLEAYGIPRYEPNYNFEAELKRDKIRLFSVYDAPGIDLYRSNKAILRRLKTIAIELEFDPNWTAESDALFVGEPIDNDLLKEVFGEKQSHFILHWDITEYYVPVSFNDVSVPDWFLWTIGSSINLRDELQEIADKLKFNLGNYTPDFQMLYEERFDELVDDTLFFEKFMLLKIYNIALGSVKHNLLIEINS